MDEEIGDTGEFVPYARKHMADKTGRRTQGDLRLSELWPEPDWGALINAGLDIEVAARLAMLYDGLLRSPRVASWGLSDEEWANAYLRAIDVLRNLFATTRTIEDFDAMYMRMLAMMGLDRKTLRQGGLQEIAPAYAAGGIGNRRMRANTGMTVRQEIMGQWLARLGWPAHKHVKDASLFPLELEDGTWRIARADTNRYTWNDDVVLVSEQGTIRAIHERISVLKQELPQRPTSRGARIGWTGAPAATSLRTS